MKISYSISLTPSITSKNMDIKQTSTYYSWDIFGILTVHVLKCLLMYSDTDFGKNDLGIILQC